MMQSAFVIPADLDARLGPLDAPEPLVGTLCLAAVVALLLPVGKRDARLVLIERSPKLRTHAGQLAFPGGKVEAQDRSLLGAALREATEEVGLNASLATPLGSLSSITTPTGFLVVPFVARVDAPWEPRVASEEVRAVLTPRLSELADPAVHHVSHREIFGRRRTLHEFAIHRPPLWGATAAMVWDLLQRMGYAPED